LDGNKEAKKTPILTLLIRKADRSWAKSDNEKVTMFEEHFEQVFTPHSNINLTASVV
jgi:hypothetical protein